MYSKNTLLQTTFYVSTTAVSLDYYFLAIGLVLTSSRSVILACAESKDCIPPGLIGVAYFVGRIFVFLSS